MSLLAGPIDFFADPHTDLVVEDRARIRERMELAVLAARIDVRRKRVDKLPVDVAAYGRFVEILIADTADDGLKTKTDELTNYFTTIDLPQGKDPVHCDACEVLFAPAPEILERDVAEGDARHTIFLVCEQASRHLALVLVVRTAFTDRDYV